VSDAPDYAFPQSVADEARRLQLLEDHLDPTTKRRLEPLGVGADAKCLELGAGRGSIARWLADLVGPSGRVVATDLQLDLLRAVVGSNVEVVRHDLRTDTFPAGSFDLIHARAVLMHLPDDSSLLARMVSWLAPGGWLVLEEADFGLWLGDLDRLWAAHPGAAQAAFPQLSLFRGRSLLKQIIQVGLIDVDADGQVDIVHGGTPLAEFYRLSVTAIGPRAVAAGALTREQAAALVDKLAEPDFLGCGFVYIGVWGRRPRVDRPRALTTDR
jgi:SAM-dependent methyltransferase